MPSSGALILIRDYFKIPVMIHSIILVAFLLSFPIFIMRMERRSKVIRWISPIIICYLVGILIGNIPVFILNGEVQETTTEISVVLAIPLLLFSANLPVLVKQVKPALFSFLLGVSGVILCALFAYWIFRDRIPDADAVSGMMIGVYTGGTQNMSAIGMGLKVEEETFVLLNSADIIFSGIYFIFLLTAARRIMSRILPGYKIGQNGTADRQTERTVPERATTPVNLLAGLIMASLLVGVAIASSMLILGKIAEPVVILIITTLGIAASFFPRIRALPGTFTTANYMLLVFAVSMGSMANFTELLKASSALFWFCGFMVFGSILVHYLLAWIFKVDTDTLMITSTAAIFGPAFIGPVASALGNREIIPIGIALGLIGYAIGNYLGLAIAFILK
jgi:uncharacterized membrane protein